MGDGLHGMGDGLHGMGDGFHTFCGWISYFFQMDSTLFPDGFHGIGDGFHGMGWTPYFFKMECMEWGTFS